jgi:hypothetical protein
MAAVSPRAVPAEICQVQNDWNWRHCKDGVVSSDNSRHAYKLNLHFRHSRTNSRIKMSDRRTKGSHFDSGVSTLGSISLIVNIALSVIPVTALTP